MAAGSNIAFKTAAKLLQTVTWLLLTGDRNSSSRYATASSLNPYDVRFSYNTCVTNKQTDRHRQATTDDTSCQSLYLMVDQKW